MKIIYRILSWFITILLPIALTFLGLRLLLTHAYLQAVYRTPGFPADDYGFTLQDRLHWGSLSVDYLLNNADISFLGNLKFSDGSSIFNDRELSHMADVKKVVQGALVAGYSVWAALILLGVWAWFGGWRDQFFRGLQRGGWVTIGLVAVLGIFGATSFWQFFTLFHDMFFAAGSWEFLYSDTLIRLFPLPFWEDAFFFAGLLDVACGLALGLGLRRMAK